MDELSMTASLEIGSVESAKLLNSLKNININA
jgi:hypothetical protein